MCGNDCNQNDMVYTGMLRAHLLDEFTLTIECVFVRTASFRFILHHVAIVPVYSPGTIANDEPVCFCFWIRTRVTRRREEPEDSEEEGAAAAD